MATIVIDADVIIGFLSSDDLQHERAVQLLSPWLEPDHRLLISASVYTEILVRPLQAEQADQIDEFLRDARIEVVPVDRAVARRAAEIRAKSTGVRLPDALALATALQLEATFVTLDLRLRRIAAGEDATS